MQNEYIQHIRYKLERRFKRLNSTSYPNFCATLQRIWIFLQNTPQISGIIELLVVNNSELEGCISEIISDSDTHMYPCEEKNAAVCYFFIKTACTWHDDSIVLNIGASICGASKYSELMARVYERFVEPLYDYIDERLDDTGAILALLIKYKHKCEWFQRQQLFKAWADTTQKGEKTLALHLYEFLHEQDIKFSIEPTSASGEIDLIADQVGTERLIADAKIYNPDKNNGKAYIIKAINQIYTYTQDYNENVGYLTIFNTSATELRLSLTGCAQTIPYITLNNKTIFLIIIDIYPHTESASVRKPAKFKEITMEDIEKGRIAAHN